MCYVLYNIYQILNISSQIFYLAISNVIASLPLGEKGTFLSYFINAQIEIWTSTWIFGTYHIWVNANTMGLNSDLSLNLHVYFLYMGEAMALANLHIYTVRLD